MRRGLIGLLALSGCATTIHQVQVSDFAPYANHADHYTVSGWAEHNTVMGFDEDNSYVELAWRDLQSKCTNGVITAITAESSTKLGFFNWTNKMLFYGICVVQKAEPAAPPSEEGTPGEPGPTPAG